MRTARKVLVVDDDPVIGRSFDRVLSGKGYAVITAEDGIDALQRVERQPVDAVVLDLMLPRMDGRDVKRGFDAHARMRNVPVILITGHVAPDIDPDAFACVLYKPISIDTLAAAVRDCLAKAGCP